jgi:glycosyltransferase involved in cell wall biosynthesis
VAVATDLHSSPLAAQEPLDESYRIIIVVTLENLPQLDATLCDVKAKSFSSSISILGCDEPRLREALAGLDVPVQLTLPAAITPGTYWTTLISHVDSGVCRTLFVSAGTQVPQDWDARLVAVGQKNPDALAIAPLCARHPIISAFAKADHNPKLSVEEVDQWLNDYARGIEFTVPVLLESCLLLQGNYWLAHDSHIETDQALLDTLRVQGRWLLATDQLYVDDTLANCSHDISAVAPAILNAFEERHPLAMMRHALLELSLRGEKPAVSRQCLPVELHVGHSWGGGLSRWIENYIDADNSRNHLVLRSIGERSAFGQQIALYGSAEMLVPLRTWVLSEPIHSTVIGHYEYGQLLKEVIGDFNVESLTISSVIGHSMDVLRTALPTTCVLHDFFPFCPALYACYEGPCKSCTADELAGCGSSNPLHSFFKLESDAHWLQTRDSFLELLKDQRISIVAPSASVVERYRTLDSRMQERPIHVLGHGLADELAVLLSSVRDAKTLDGERFRIVMLGRVTSEKGGDLLAELIEPLCQFADLWLLGAGEKGEQFKGIDHVTVVDEYTMPELQKHLLESAPHMGLLLSIVPETFSYTLSELWAAGIPVLATRLGAFSDRIDDGVNGWLEAINAGSILGRIKTIEADRPGLALVKKAVVEQPLRTASEMVADYQLLRPHPGFVAARRFHLPLRTFQNPYRQTEVDQQTLLYIERTHGVEATYRGVLREFLQYSAEKVGQTPRLPGPVRTLLRRLLDLVGRAL